MGKDFESMLKNAFKEREEEKKLFELGATDTAKLSREQYRSLFGKMAGIESSTTNREHNKFQIGRLTVLEHILGSDSFGDLMQTLGLIFEEYLFGLPGGEPSEYRITEDNVTKKDGEY